MSNLNPITSSSRKNSDLISFPILTVTDSRYVVRLASTEAEIESAQRLRYRVLNLEFGEGAAKSFADGKDADDFDAKSDHPLLIDRLSDQVVGTCRILRPLEGETNLRFHLGRTFDLSSVSTTILHNATEFDRLCITKSHRFKSGFKLLW